LENPICTEDWGKSGKAAFCPDNLQLKPAAGESSLQPQDPEVCQRHREIPDPLPFAGVEFYPRESMRYHSKLDPAVLLQAGLGELSEADPDAFKALLLALGAGLRRGEIDRLLWRQIDFNAGVIHIETTEASGLKSSDSAGDVPIDERLSSILQGCHARALGPYVLEEGTGLTASRLWGNAIAAGMSSSA
jgi:integrase